MSTAGCGPRGRPKAANFEGVRDSLGIANASPRSTPKRLQLIDVEKRCRKIGPSDKSCDFVVLQIERYYFPTSSLFC